VVDGIRSHDRFPTFTGRLRVPGAKAMSFARTALFSPYVVGLVAGTASGAAMLPYTVIKEASPPEAILLTFFLKETGPAIRLPEQITARGGHGSNSRNGKVRSAAR
jgi:hypothetical protein